MWTTNPARQIHIKLCRVIYLMTLLLADPQRNQVGWMRGKPKRYRGYLSNFSGKTSHDTLNTPFNAFINYILPNTYPQVILCFWITRLIFYELRGCFVIPRKSRVSTIFYYSYIWSHFNTLTLLFIFFSNTLPLTNCNTLDRIFTIIWKRDIHIIIFRYFFTIFLQL